MDLLSITPDLWPQYEAECLERLSNGLQWNSIPLLNANDLQNLQDGRLVRFRGMVQDMFNPEYYYEKYEVIDEQASTKSIRNGKFIDVTCCKDNEVINYDSNDNVTGERQTLVVVSVPALNEWAQNIEKEQHKLNTNLHSDVESPTRANKRALETDDCMETEQNSNSNVKKPCSKTKPKFSVNVSREHLLNFPLADRIGKVCHVKVYNDFNGIKLNDMLDVVGFLSMDPVMTDVDYDEYDSKLEIQTHNPPPSLIPRIHCIAQKRMQHDNPLMGFINVEVENMQCLKKELHLVLSQLLLGDTTAAEYFIYHLISQVYLRNEMMALGKFTLNLSQIPADDVPDFGKRLYDFVEILVPKSHYLPMTLDNMNETTFIPKKDYECDRVTSGLLQLSNGTHLVLDETKLTPGQLNAAGVKAVAALANTIKLQKTTYDFNYFPMEFDCDIPFLILSEGKSLLPSDFHVPLRPDQTCISTFNEIAKAARHFLKPELLNSLRVYLTLARNGKYELSNNVQELVQNEFVRMRQEKTVTPDDLHQLLVVARLVCLSEGKASLDAECWKKACDLEAERKRRL